MARDMLDMFGHDAFAAIYVDPGFEGAVPDSIPVATDWPGIARMGSHFMVAVSAIEHRERLIALAIQAGLRPSSPMVSRLAVVARDAEVADGCAIGHHAVIGPKARLDQHVLVMHNSVVGHDSQIHEGCVLCAGVSIGGAVCLESGCFIGPNAAIAPRVRVAAGTFMSAGTACLRDVPVRSTLIGNPARAIDLSRTMDNRTEP